METKQIFSEEVDARIYDSLVQMLEDGERDSDRQFLVCSGYRSVDFQQTLFDNKIAEIQAEHPEYTTRKRISRHLRLWLFREPVSITQA